MPPEPSQQIEQLYHAARELEPDQRDRFLQQACAGDEGLRREVASLLAQDDAVKSFLETPALELARHRSGADAGQSMIGRHLGSFQILSLLGRGGMGEVYRARDTRLQREVALKLVPGVFASDPERLARFQREAEVLASLNHPNIAQIYGMEGTGGSGCIVMELVEGDTLEERLKRGPIPVNEALLITKQIAEALEAAHEKDIIHRDLKPANVKISPEGRVKVLDFGLAKPLDDPNQGFSKSPTGAGVILGTAAYMSPEQAQSKKIDMRADIWAFGCVLYELLSGKQAFECENVTETLAAVLKVDPDWTRLPATTPAGIRVLLRRCLQKDAARRLRDAADARIEIEDALSTPESISATVSSRPVQRWVLLSGLACLLAAVLAGLAAWSLKPPPSPAPVSVSRFTITLPAGQVLAGPEQPAMALSPDGSRLAYAASMGGVQQLYLRAMDSLEARLIAGTEGAAVPFFSPDGQSVGFFAGGKLQKVSITGGAVSTISGRPYPGGASWGSHGMIAFPPRINSSLQQVPETGGDARPITRLETGERIHVWPEFLPGGKAVLFVAVPNPGDSPMLAAQDIRTGARKNLVRNATQPRYAPPGYLASHLPSGENSACQSSAAESAVKFTGGAAWRST